MYSPKLTKKSRIIVLTKIDTVTDFEKIDKIQLYLESKKENVFRISSLSKEGIPELINFLEAFVNKERNYSIEDPISIKQLTKSEHSIWKD